MIRSDLDFDDNKFFSTEVRHFLLMTGGTFIVNNDFRLTPQMKFRAAENSPWGLDLNLSGTWKDKYSAGMTYRTGGARGDFGESLDFIVAAQVSERIMVGFAYDATLSRIRAIDNGSLEMILSYNLIPRKIKTIMVVGVPSLAVDQLVGEPGRWFGADEALLDDVLPRLRQFERRIDLMAQA